MHNHMARVAYESERRKRKARAVAAAQQDSAAAAGLRLEDTEAPV